MLMMQRKTDIIRLVVAVDYLIEVTAMAKGVIYIMATSVKGLIKIGKTDNFKSRMAKLEQDGIGMSLVYILSTQSKSMTMTRKRN